MALADILARHRGPYRLLVYRPGTHAGFSRSEWLTGLVEPEDVGSEAWALLTDPRDCVDGVSVWSTHSDQFVTTISKERDL